MHITCISNNGVVDIYLIYKTLIYWHRFILIESERSDKIFRYYDVTFCSKFYLWSQSLQEKLNFSNDQKLHVIFRPIKKIQKIDKIIKILADTRLPYIIFYLFCNEIKKIIILWKFSPAINYNLLLYECKYLKKMLYFYPKFYKNGIQNNFLYKYKIKVVENNFS